MRALRLVADRKLELADLPSPATPAAGEVQIKIRAVALNHLDLWGYRGMAFARRKLPIVVGVEAAGEIAAIGPDAASCMPAVTASALSPSRWRRRSAAPSSPRSATMPKPKKPRRWAPIT